MRNGKILRSSGSYHPRIMGELTLESYLQQLRIAGDGYLIYDSEVVTPNWWQRRVCGHKAQHVMLLDCDGTKEMLAAAHTLATRGMAYVTIQSSPSRYWIVVDKVGYYVDLALEAQTIPGVDQDYIKVLCRTGFFALRVVPEAGKMALFPEGGAGHFKNPLARQWYDDFKWFWDRPEMKERAHTERVRKSLEDGTIADLAADPEFIL